MAEENRITRTQVDALNEMHILFRDGGFWNAVHYDNSSTRTLSRQCAATLATAAIGIMELLTEYPALASETIMFSYSEDDVDEALNELFPLELFIWNSFGKRLLDRIFSLYPSAASDLMQYVRNIKRVDSEETLLWVISKCENMPPPYPRLPLLELLLLRFRRTQWEYHSNFSTEVIKAAIETRPKEKIPLSLLFHDDYSEEVLTFAVEMHAKHGEDSIVLSETWPLNQMHARVLANVLPKMKELIMSKSDYTLDGWIDILENLQTCHDMKTVNLTLKPSWLVSNDPTGIAALRSFLHNKPSTMRILLNLDGMSTESENEVLMSKDNGHFFSELLDGNDEVQTKDPSIDCLELNRFRDLSGIRLQQLADMAVKLKLRSVSISTSTTGDMNFGVFECERFTPNLWKSICDVSKSVTLAPVGHLGLSLSITVAGALPDQKEITNLVVELLQCNFLFSLYLGSSYEVDQSTQRFLEFGRVFEALRSCSLSMLTVETLGIRYLNPQAIPSMLAQVLESENTTLADLVLSDGCTLYTLQNGESLHPCRYVDYKSAIKVQHFLYLNSCRRANLRSKSATVADVVKILDRAMTLAHYFSRKLIPIVDDMAPRLDIAELEQLDMNFQHLMETVNEWSKAPLHQHAIDTQNVLFGLLRESSGLWCTRNCHSMQ